MDACQRFCDRVNACQGCVAKTCLPNCVYDSTSGISGAQYVTWMSCFLSGPASCQASDSCTNEYCAYANANSSPGTPIPGCP